MKVAGDPSRAKPAKRRPPLRATQGSESAPSPEPRPELEALIDEGIEIFSRRYGRAVGREEVRQMIERLTVFFELLAECRDREQDGPDEGDVAA